MARIGSLTADMELQSAAFLRDMRRASQAVASNSAQMRRSMRQVETASRNVQKAFGQLRAGAVALGGALAVRQFTQFTRSAVESGGAILDTAKKIGVGVEALKQLRFAAAQVGVNQRTLDMGLQRFSRRLGEVAQGAGELKDTLKLYGIAVRDSDGRTRSVVDVLGDLADTVKNAGSAQEQLRIAFKAFDSEGAALVNMLRDGRVGLEQFMQQARDFGVVMSRNVVAQAKLASDNLTTLQFIASAAFNTAVVRGFAGSLTLTRENMESTRAAAENFGRAVGMAMRGVSAAAKLVGENLRTIATVMAGLIALKAASVFAAAGAAVVKFGRALVAAARGGALLGAILSKSIIGAVVKLAITLGVATVTYKSFGAEIEKVSKAMEEAGRLFSGTGSDIGGATNKVRDSIKAKQQEAENWNRLTAALRQGDEEYRRVKDSLDLTAEAARIGAKAGTKLGDEWRGAAAAARQAQRANEKLAESYRNASALGQEFGQSIGSAFADAITEGKKFSEVLRALQKDIMQLVLRQAVTAPLGNIFGSFFRPLGAATAHAGGVVGVDPMPKTVLPAMAWAGAPKFHGGGVVGADEVPILARHGEGIFTREQMRALGIGSGAARAPKVEVVVINNSGGQVSTTEHTRANGDRRIEVIVERLLNDHLASGRADKAMSRYGSRVVTG